ncbi:MAG: single-stranded-DNA-specific exonuclease RecJ [Arenimonas sp.]
MKINRRIIPANGPWPENVSPVLQRIFASRGVNNPEQAELKLANLLLPDQMSGMDSAVDLLLKAIQSQKHIVIVGDFDCDGATGTAVAMRGLRMLGAEQLSYQVPHRILHGYGLSQALVEHIVEMRPELIITVDNGIACHAGVEAAKAHGWQVLITDHHLPGDVLPPADAIVNPNLQGDNFPSKALSGVGVMFYLLLALRKKMRDLDILMQPEPDLSTLLDLVAVGTVADLVSLDYNNRLLVSAGIKRFRKKQCQVGLKALAEISGRDLEKLVASDIGFAIGPRLNAAGRLEDMSLGIECLLTDDESRAYQLAEILNGINAERRGLQQQMVDDADALVDIVSLEHQSQSSAWCFYDQNWHPGVVGLVASKLKERLHRPVIAFAPADDGSEILRGSARSIPGFHIRDALAEVDSKHPGMIERFGGHAMAAGLSLQKDSLDAFRAAFNAVAELRLSAELLQAECLSDGELQIHEFSRELAEDLRLAGPWGQGFPEPVFDNIFEVKEWKVLSERHLKYSLRLEGTDFTLSAIHFGGYAGVEPPRRLHAAYQLELDDFRGRRDIQLLIRHSLPA